MAEPATNRCDYSGYLPELHAFFHVRRYNLGHLFSPAAPNRPSRVGCRTIQNMSSPISVIIFVRNAASTIERALASVVEQQVPGLELIVLDAGSTDGTVDVIRRYADHIAWWRSAPDGGPTAAINEGVERAGGDVICLLPADDWLEPGALQAVAAEFAADPDLDVLSCGTRIVHFEPDGEMRVDALFNNAAILEFSMDNIVRFPLTAGRFIRRRIYQQLGNHDNHYRIGCDLDFLVRVCAAGLKAKVLEQVAYTYRRHARSMTLSGNPRMVLLMMSDEIEIAETCLARATLSAPDRRALIGMHGRASTRLAWMHLTQGRVGDAFRLLGRAWRMNLLWPVLVPFWIVRGWRERRRLARVA